MWRDVVWCALVFFCVCRAPFSPRRCDVVWCALVFCFCMQGPVQFQKMEKPPGWQQEQAVEIRRDWIAYLADGMGIDAPGATGPELETLVVRRMLEQAVRLPVLTVFLDLCTI